MELRHLRYFVAVAEALSFTKAARQLRLAQPSLTRQVRNLENEIGVELLDRTHNRVSLTAAGRRFLSDARKLLAQCAEMVVTAQQPDSNAVPEINIGYVAQSHPPFLAATLATFRKMRPGIVVNLFDMSRSAQCLALRDGRIDVGFVGLDPSYHGSAFESLPIGRDDIVAALPSRTSRANGGKLALRELSSYAFIAMAGTSNPGAREWLEETCAEAGFACRVLQEAHEETEALKFVADGFGVALVTQRSPALRKKGVKLQALTPPLQRSSKMAWRAENVSENLAEYIRIVKDLRVAE